jgi:NAD(P)-dependent dehydrogenase (short-subunit alcohol dehydrogenase family)
VKAYRDRNYRVIANSRSIKPSKDSDVPTIAGDVADSKTADRIVQEGLARFGRIDTLINNAGIFIAKPLVHLERRNPPIQRLADAHLASSLAR